jgi:gliding motility-associatede transport system auxiliary component
VAMRPDEAPSQHIGIVGLDRDSMNADDVVTSGLDLVNVMTAGALEKKKDAEVGFEPLLQSSTDAALLPAMRFAYLPDSHALLEDFKPTGERYVVAARLHGKLKSAYPDGPPDAKDGGDRPAHLAESAGEANVIVVADTDMLSDPLWLRSQSMFGQQFSIAWANNGDFLANAVENLAGSSDLISIRGRQSFFRPFTRVDALRRQADERLRAKEQELDHELQETEHKLSALEANRSDQGSFQLSPEQQAEVKRFQDERLRIRRELREVRHGLDVEIDRLGTWLKVIDIALVPALLAIGAIVLAVMRRRRLRAGRAAAHAG